MENRKKRVKNVIDNLNENEKKNGSTMNLARSISIMCVCIYIYLNPQIKFWHILYSLIGNIYSFIHKYNHDNAYC